MEAFCSYFQSSALRNLQSICAYSGLCTIIGNEDKISKGLDVMELHSGEWEGEIDNRKMI